ncbi:hypothetical protein PaecuDRAFT_2143 [Paenibacillus curdlanolyticus YK9]|uniref:Methylamine utilisation protein MauE domain-containing protein n=1 Tax=Paenibacillus curdlanolyticus YK9 TaxID=717606 RepID=E0I909_9BACL|nr:MauE/DoxX family redox-associated membrane protein [Paenibacillus curdlanolyticus]EFM10893.1 hypothetical protein PaecuDRAFT_2143 [Paenibacillus curdlanolyticus YK9]
MRMLDVLIALIFLISFNMKQKNTKNLQYEVVSYYNGFKAIAGQLAYLLLGAELLIVVLFWMPYLVIAKALLSIGMLLVFSYVTYRKRKEKGQATCTCFGDASWLNKAPLTRNAAFIVIIMASTIIHLSNGAASSATKFDIALSIGIVVALDSALVIKTLKRMSLNDA